MWWHVLVLITAPMMLTGESPSTDCVSPRWTRPRTLFEDYRKKAAVEPTSDIDSGRLEHFVSGFFECWKAQDVECALEYGGPDVDRTAERQKTKQLFASFAVRSFRDLGAIVTADDRSEAKVYTAIVGVVDEVCYEDIMMRTWRKRGEDWQVASVGGEIP